MSGKRINIENSLRPYALVIGLAICPLAIAASPPAPPTCTDEVYQAFDFWVGDWQVDSLDGVLQGTNSVNKHERGCLITEHWKGAQGGSGQSYNYYNPTTQSWQQLWVSQGAIIDYSGGLTDAGAMRLVGSISYRANGKTFPFVGKWTPKDNGTVLQELKQLDPETGEWQDWFIGVYSPRREP